MHDPLVVAFEIRRPWPTKRDSTGWRHWPSLVTVWHREPGGHDALTICQKRVQMPDGGWKYPRTWRWHVNHWKIQVHAMQELRRRLLTRCTWCGGRSRKGDAVDTSHSWDGPRSRWWQGECGLYHGNCSGIARAHSACVCADPITDGEGYGSCARCGKYRGFGWTEESLARMRELATVPRGQRRRRS
ncbi:hypothetical protein [Nonomuraea sp. NPDC023979]|uniref:hypothetical protein n=1 Tax=Nonomuraea sp. NPDC023979 TaxID=3154796 RepID=UPI0033F87E25